MTFRRCLVLLTLLLVTAGCGDDPADDASPTPAATPSPTATRAPYDVIDGPLDRCGPQPAAASEAGFDYLKLRDPAVGTIPAVRAGSGRTVVVLLHQTDGNGLCGWLGFAPPLAAEPRFSVLAVDLCGYGEARCVEDPDQVGPVELAIDYARTAMKARKVLVVGASMGGSVALVAATRLPGIAAAVDLSGPVEWEGMETVRQGRALSVPVLVAMADDEGEDEVTGARRIVDNAPRGSEFVPAEAGHGYELLMGMDDQPTPIADQLLSWIAAR